MADDEHDYKVGHGHPPLRTRFKKGQSGNPGGRRKKPLPALLADALNEPVFVTIDGERRQITKREAIVHQLVNKSTTADLRATKMLFDMMKEAEQKASGTAPAPKPRPLEAPERGADPADRNVRCAALSRPTAERQTEAQEILRDHGRGIGAAGTQGRLIATGGEIAVALKFSAD